MKDEIKKRESKTLKALSSLSKNSLNNSHTSPSAVFAQSDENVGLVQFTSHGLDSD